MKIRTDFVTNSSSSSYMVCVCVDTTDGHSHSIVLYPDTIDGNFKVDFNCSAKSILESDSVASLCEYLSDGIEIDTEIQEKQWYEDEEEEYDDSKTATRRFKNMMEKISSEYSNIDEIETITFEGQWEAWGECSSCFGANLDIYAKELEALAAKVCETQGEEKEKAKEELQNYLSNYSGRIKGEAGGSFPSGFLGAVYKGEIVWNRCAKSIEEFAQKVVDKDLSNNDYAEETVTIDFKTKEIKTDAKYFL